MAQSVPSERRIRYREQSLTIYEPFKAEEMWKRIKIPPSPALSPEEALKSFQTVPGFRIECVASEPLIEDPIMFEFDADGRIWAVEFRGYMHDINGSTEGDPVGRVVVLEDTDGDTFMDKSTVFLDGLVMARTVQFVQGGVLIQEPPKLWFCEDTDGDLKCDKKRQVGTFGVPGDPQHTDNGLFHCIDNWMYNAKSSVRHKFVDGKLIEEETFFRGQWGMSQDDYGRLYYCYESSPLHADLFPSAYLYRNRNFRQSVGGGRLSYGLNSWIYWGSQEIYPIRVAPGITLGGRELRDDGTLRTFTIAAGVSIYRGDQFPEEYYGSAVVPEAGGNLVRLNKLGSDGVYLSASNHFGKKELVASTDERFRPLNSRTGPDGALYVSDMYKGIIEHVVFLMPYLRNQINSRGLEQPPGLGRIYRIRHEGKPLGKVPTMSRHSPEQLVRHLSHPNGWWRDTAQRLLVEKKARKQADLLRKLVVDGKSHLGRLHALWTLEGIGSLDWKTVDRAIDDSDPMVRATAVRLSERFIDQKSESARKPDPEQPAPPRDGAPIDPSKILKRLITLLEDQRPMVRLQLLLTLGEFRHDKAESVMANIVSEHRGSVFFAAAASGLEGRELEFIERLLRHPRWQKDWKRQSWEEGLLPMLAMAVFNQKDAKRTSRLLSLMVNQDSDLRWRRDMMLKGVLGSYLSRGRWPVPVKLESRPALLDQLKQSPDKETQAKASRLQRVVTWIGDKTKREREPIRRSLSVEERKRFELGKSIYAVTCLACHQENGKGQDGKAPPLFESDWVHGPPERLVRVVLHGLMGPIVVNGKKWNLAMPGMGYSPIMSDERLAAVLTYVRRAWNNWGDPVEPSLVAKVRSETKDRTALWTAEELVGTTSSSSQASSPGSSIEALAKGLPKGDSERGRVLFQTNLKSRCIACHRIGERGGGFVGPSLTGIGSRVSRHDLLQSMIDPSAKIAKDFLTVVLSLKSGESHSGIIVSENLESIAIHPPSGGKVEVPVDQVDSRITSPVSSMPPIGELFSKTEISDLLEYLVSLKDDLD